MTVPLDRPHGAGESVQVVERIRDVEVPEGVSDRNLHRLLGWIGLLAFGFATSGTAGAVALHSGWLIATASATAATGVACLIGRRLVDLGRSRSALTMLWGSLLVMGTVVTLAMPDIALVPVSVSLLISLTSVLYAGQARHWTIFGACFAWTATTLLVARLVSVGPELPAEFVSGIRTAGGISTVGLVLALLLDFHGRLGELVREARDAETRYRTLVERLPAITYIDEITGPGPDDIRPLYVSPKLQTILGYTVEEWLGDPSLWADRILHPDDRERIIKLGLRADEQGTPFSAEYRAVAKDGRTLWIQEESVRVDDPDGRPRYWQGALFDITARTRADEELRESFELLRRTDMERQRLLQVLVSAEEVERRRIAEAIHDDPVQKITAVGLRLQLLRRSLSDPEQIEIVDGLQDVVRLAIDHLRHMMFDLRPPSLDAGGLVAAVREFVDLSKGELRDCRVEDRLISEPPDGIRTVAYRIAVEALSNVQRHAEASRVDVLLEEREGGLFLRVRDDGVGMDPEILRNGRPGHLGITYIRERAEMVGGWSRIESRPGAGTTVEAWLPGSGVAEA